jgi:hypothetical protein
VVPTRSSLLAFVDSEPGDPLSGIRLIRQLDLGTEGVRGLNMLYDGSVVFVTSEGVVGVVDPKLRGVVDVLELPGRLTIFR